MDILLLENSHDSMILQILDRRQSSKIDPQKYLILIPEFILKIENTVNRSRQTNLNDRLVLLKSVKIFST